MDQSYNAATSPDSLVKEGVASSHDGTSLTAEDKPENYDVFVRIGHLTRKLHDALRELGYDHQLENTVGSLPDARARLSYIADLTGNAAEKVLGLVDEKIASDDVFAEQVKNIASVLDGAGNESEKMTAVRQFLGCAQTHCDQSRSMMTDIMMAQDFHDLTGQTIKKVADIAHNVEQQLVQLLLDTTPPPQRNRAESQFMEGPVIDKTRTDTVHDQGQVDDLLAQLGF
jgi:chemotaxis protein CheZ